MKILLSPIGSRGDVQPLVALGARLMAAGHMVRIAGSPNGSTLAQEYHLDYHPVGFNIKDLLQEEQTQIANPVSLFIFFSALLDQAIEEQFDELKEHVETEEVEA